MVNLWTLLIFTVKYVGHFYNIGNMRILYFKCISAQESLNIIFQMHIYTKSLNIIFQMHDYTKMSEYISFKVWKNETDEYDRYARPKTVWIIRSDVFYLCIIHHFILNGVEDEWTLYLHYFRP